MARRNTMIPSGTNITVEPDEDSPRPPLHGQPLSGGPYPVLPPSDEPGVLGIADPPPEDPLPNQQSPISNQQSSVLLEVPIGELARGHVTRHIDLNGLTRAEGEAICRLSAALHASDARLEGGKPVGLDRTKAVRWLVQQLAKQLA